MAPVRGTAAKLYFGDATDCWDFSCDTNTLTTTITVDPIEYMTLCSTAKDYVPYIPVGNLEHQGYYSGKGSDYIEQELYTRLGSATAAYAAALFGTGTTGCPAYVIDTTWADQLQFQAPLTDLIALNGRWADNAPYRGLRVYTGTLSGTGGQTAVDFGSAGSSGGKAWLFITAITGTATNATVTVESSSDNVSFANEGTFTFSNVGVETATLTGTVNRYVRVNCTSLGGATNFTVLCIAQVAGVSG